MIALVLVTWSLLISHVTVLAQTQSPANFVFSINEQLAEGTYVGNVRRDTNITLTYQIFSDIELGVYLQVDSSTGELTTTDIVFDRDTKCAFSRICALNGNIYERAGDYLGILNVTVYISDINDNVPAFRNAPNTLNITESEVQGKQFTIGTVFDRDLPGNNTIQDVSIIQVPENKFELKKSSVYDGYKLVLEVTGALDREIQDHYDVTIVATDGGSPINTGSLTIRVNIEDENDNGPIFEKPEYTVTIDENVVLHTVILQVRATDADIGQNAAITYSFSEREQTEIIRRLFHIDASTGNISVIADLTHEANENYEFNVEAANGFDSFTNSTKVKITVNDVENNSPIVAVTLLTAPSVDNTAYIEENQPEDYVVAHVTARDNDKGENGNFSCESSDPLFKLEVLQGLGYKISVAGVLDREQVASYDVTVTCTDNGNPPKSATNGFSVNVMDVNDNDPNFEQPLYRATITENNSIDATITTVKATDDDFGANGTVEYMFKRADTRLKINNKTGVITARINFDRETESYFELSVLAVDHGTVLRRTSSVVLQIQVNDTNDNKPDFVPTRPEFWISENLPANAIVGVLEADDEDLHNGTFLFTLTATSHTFPFVLSPNGEIRTTKSLDRELESSYQMSVTVSDLTLSNSRFVNIYVTDVNDNSPIVTFPNAENDTVTFEYREDKYNVVTTVASYDIDNGVNGTLNFSIIAGNEDGIFELDAKLGEVSVVKFLEIDSDRTFILDIEVKDKGQIPRSTECTLKVILIRQEPADAQPVVGDESNQYIIISAVVIVTTICVAIAIIGVIFFLRRLDSHKGSGPDEASTRYSDSGVSSGTGSQETDEDYTDGGKKKKEVKFSEYKISGLSGETSTDDNNVSSFKLFNLACGIHQLLLLFYR